MVKHIVMFKLKETLSAEEKMEVMNRFKAAIEALQTMTAATCKVIRDGEQIVLHSDELVPGDVVVLEDLKNIKPVMVFFEGKKVAENGKLCVEIEEKSFELEQTLQSAGKDDRLKQVRAITDLADICYVRQKEQKRMAILDN